MHERQTTITTLTVPDLVTAKALHCITLHGCTVEQRQSIHIKMFD